MYVKIGGGNFSKYVGLREKHRNSENITSAMSFQIGNLSNIVRIRKSWKMRWV